jgi:hypothetical protein
LDYVPRTSKGTLAQGGHEEKIVHAENKLDWGKRAFKKHCIHYEVDLQEIFELNFNRKFENKKKITMKNWILFHITYTEIDFILGYYVTSQNTCIQALHSSKIKYLFTV